MLRGLTLAFAAGDVGGARAILPVAKQAAEWGATVVAMRHGILHAEGAPDWTWCEPGLFADARFWESGPAAFIYATSVSDSAAVCAAVAARSAGKPILHVLDNWSSYATRLTKPGDGPCVPDVYAVMDDLAADGARTDGVPEDILRVTGHPGLAYLATEFLSVMNRRDSETTDIFFVSEPARADSGGPQAPGWRGYDEVQVSFLAARALTRLADEGRHGRIRVRVAPHPREDREAVALRWKELCRASGLGFWLVKPREIRATLHGAQAVLGMSSLLLYEAWLLGKPVMSLQPGLRRSDLAVLGRREGLIFCDDAASAEAHVRSLLSRPKAPSISATRALSLHRDAPGRVLDLAVELVAAFAGQVSTMKRIV